MDRHKKQPKTTTEANLAMKPRERTAAEKFEDRPGLSAPVVAGDAVLDDASGRPISETEAELKETADADRPVGSAGGKRDPD